jgi:hypothetical protein
MAQIFSPRADSWIRRCVVGGIITFATGVWTWKTVYWSPFHTRAGVPLEQPVPFSHQHHAGGLGIDCRFCHSTVEKSASAGMPSTETCMMCHSQIWTNAPLLAPVRKSIDTGQPLRWTRVHDLPDFAYFDHSIHVTKGVGCSTCHGRVDEMPLTWKVNTLFMKWCIDCHRDPTGFLRPRDRIFDMTWKPPPDQSARGRELANSYRINSSQLLDCGICHR